MKKKGSKKEMLKLVKSGLRLKAKPPKTETPATVYSRKPKHKRRIDNETSSFFFTASFHAMTGIHVIQS